jgi:signal peptidase II
MSRWPRPLFYLTFAGIVAADQLTKLWVASSFVVGESRPLLPGWFNLTYVQNTGIAFGMFQGAGLLVALFVVALVVGGIYFTRGLNWSALEPNLVGGALCGGALGNLIDRARLGHVIDFLDAHWGPHHWPVFNVSDSVICMAVGWILLRQFEAKP